MEAFTTNILLIVFFLGVFSITITLLVLEVKGDRKLFRPGNKIKSPNQNQPFIESMPENSTRKGSESVNRAKVNSNDANKPLRQKYGITEVFNKIYVTMGRQAQRVESTEKEKPETEVKNILFTEIKEKSIEGKVKSKEPILDRSPSSTDSFKETREITLGHGNPQAQPVLLESNIVEASPNPSPDIVNARPASPMSSTLSANKEEKESELSMDTKPSVESAKSNSEQPQAKQEPIKSTLPESEKNKNQEPREQKTTAGDLADLFAKNTVEENESGRLAEGMSDVKVEDLLKEGLALMGKLRKPKS